MKADSFSVCSNMCQFPKFIVMLETMNQPSVILVFIFWSMLRFIKNSHFGLRVNLFVIIFLYLLI